MAAKKINPYNLLAEVIAELRIKDRDLYNDPAKRRTTQDNPSWKQEVEELFRQYPQLKDHDVICMNGIDEPAANAVRGWMRDHGFFPVLTLAKRLETVIPWEEQAKLAYAYQNQEDRQNRDGTFSALNGNGKETGVVLFPRVPSFQDNWAPSAEEAISTRKWRSYYDPGINQELKNVYCAAAEALTLRGKLCRVSCCVMDEMPVSLRKTVRIGMSPLLRDARLRKEVYFRPAGEERENLLSLFGIENWPRVKARIRAAFLEACRQSVDILVFPEMLGGRAIFTPELRYSDFLSELAGEAEREGLPAPYLIIGPSWWHDHHNQLYVMRGSGDYVCVQEKQFPYEHEEDGQNYLEDIQPGTPEIHIVHIPWLGRIAFPICADLLYEEMQDLLVRTLHCNFLICPSFSRGKTLFTRICEAGVAQGITAIWLNTCSAPEEFPGYLGVLVTPGQNVRLCPECSGKCGGDSGACLFVSDLDIRTGTFGAVCHLCQPAGVDST